MYMSPLSTFMVAFVTDYLFCYLMQFIGRQEA